MSMRKKFEPALKARIALEALKGEKTLAQISVILVPFEILLTNLLQNHASKCPRDRLELRAGTL